jgi:hypothetical protein
MARQTIKENTMAEQYYGDPRNFDIVDQGIKKNVEVKVSRMNNRDKSDLRSYFQNYSLDPDTAMVEGFELPAGAIEQLVIRRAVSGITIGTNKLNFTTGNPVDALGDVAMGDEEEDVDIYEEILKTIVDRNRWLARRQPFAMVFAQYLSAVLDDKSDAEEEIAEKAKEKGMDAPAKDEKPEDGVGDDPLDTKDSPGPTRLSGSDLAGPTKES